MIDHFYMKKIELLHFTVTKNWVSTARHCRVNFFVNCSNPVEPGLTGFEQLINFVSSSWSILFRAVDLLPKVSSKWLSSNQISSSSPPLLCSFTSLHFQGSPQSTDVKNPNIILNIVRWKVFKTFEQSLTYNIKEAQLAE